MSFTGAKRRAAVIRRDSCRLCDGRDLELVLELKPTPPAGDCVFAEKIHEVQETYPLDLFLCRVCGHAQLLDVVDPEILFRDYGYTTSTSPGLVQHFRQYAEDLLREIRPIPAAASGSRTTNPSWRAAAASGSRTTNPSWRAAAASGSRAANPSWRAAAASGSRAANPSWRAGGMVVEIGSNDGSMLRCFKERGMRVLGVDPAREIARKATESGVETLPDFFTSSLASRLKKERGSAVIITANNVFAHADDLSGVTVGIRELLAPEGVFVFEVSYLADILEKRLFDTVYHEHLCYHSVRPLVTFFRRHGMELVDVQRVPTKGGSIRVTVQRAGGTRSVSPSVEELIALEERIGLARPEAFRSFADQLKGVKNELLHRLKEIKDKGESISGYGASHTVTTLLHHFDLAPYLSFVVDDNPRKQGLFSPGHHLPILHPQALYERRPDYVLILAWNYSRPIIEKHKAFLEGGGRFIVPLPEVEMRERLS